VKDWLGPVNAVADRVGRLAAGAPAAVGFTVFAAVAALVAGFLDLKFGTDAAFVALFVGLLISIVAVTLGFVLTERRYMRRAYRDSGRLVRFQPGYLYMSRSPASSSPWSFDVAEAVGSRRAPRSSCRP
jgi:hypothetical protein